jgi:reactive chlorine resistance protein C
MQLSKTSQLIGKGIARYSLVLFFLGFGLLKFTAPEAAAIHPLLAHSPFLFWLPRLVDQRLASDIIGVIEISFGIAASLVVTLSFLVTTPGLDPALGAFIIKDATLLGVALWSAGEALAAELSRARGGDVPTGGQAPARS